MGKWTDIAVWKGNSPNHSGRDGAKITGLVVHTANGNGSGVVNWIMNDDSNISATFVVMKTGRIYQTLDTARKPWTTGKFNKNSISVECEGYFDEPFTAAQIIALGTILRKAHEVYGVRLKRSKKRGLSGHRQHMSTACPGSKRYAQLQDIVKAAKSSSPNKPSKPSKPNKPNSDWTDKLIMTLPTVKRNSRGKYVEKAQALLNVEGANLKEDGIFGPLTDSATERFQRSKGLAVDGWIGPNTWSELIGG